MKMNWVRDDVNLINIEGIGTVVIVDALTVACQFFGKDNYFEYWLGVDGVVYGI